MPLNPEDRGIAIEVGRANMKAAQVKLDAARNHANEVAASGDVDAYRLAMSQWQAAEAEAGAMHRHLRDDLQMPLPAWQPEPPKIITDVRAGAARPEAVRVQGAPIEPRYPSGGNPPDKVTRWDTKTELALAQQRLDRLLASRETHGAEYVSDEAIAEARQAVADAEPAVAALDAPRGVQSREEAAQRVTAAYRKLVDEDIPAQRAEVERARQALGQTLGASTMSNVQGSHAPSVVSTEPLQLAPPPAGMAAHPAGLAYSALRYAAENEPANEPRAKLGRALQELAVREATAKRLGDIARYTLGTALSEKAPVTPAE